MSASDRDHPPDNEGGPDGARRDPVEQILGVGYRPRRPWIFRLILPLMYAQLGFVLLVLDVGISLLLAGVHGHPPALLADALSALTMPWGLWGFGAGGFFVNLCIMVGLGYLLDRVIERPRRPR